MMARPEGTGSSFERRLKLDLKERDIPYSGKVKQLGIEFDLVIERDLFSPDYNHKIGIQAKTQHSGGSVDHKLPYELRKMEEKATELLEYFSELWWVIDGPAIRKDVWMAIEGIANKVKIIKFSDNWLDKLP